jgi:glycosyltransferase involved in cell wall biosynthesis
MRIIHVQKVAGISGSENHLLTLLPHLQARGVDVGMLVLVQPGQTAEMFVEQMRSAGIRTAVCAIRNRFDPSCISQMRRYFRQTRPNIVHTHLVHADVFGSAAARLAGVEAVVSTKHGFNEWRYARRYAFADRAAARFQDRIIAISNALKNWLIAVERLPAWKMDVVHYGVDTQAVVGAPRESFIASSSALVVGTVSRLIPQKGIDVLIRAFAQVVRTKPNVSLVVVGDGPERSNLQRLAVELRVSDRITFAGSIRHAEIGSWLSGFDVFALPTYGEGFGLALLEAMAFGKPVVASDVMAIPEILGDERAGVLVPPGNVSALSDAILRLANDSTLRANLGVTAKQRACGEFTIDAMVDRTLRIYESVAGVGNEGVAAEDAKHERLDDASTSPARSRSVKLRP